MDSTERNGDSKKGRRIGLDQPPLEIEEVLALLEKLGFKVTPKPKAEEED